jgi:predicted negative regulator of RcsB-dependent stress response
VSAYETEEQQIEAFKKWWKENGNSIIFGLILGFSLLAGWRWWHVYTDQQGQIASALYEQVMISLEKKETKLAHQFAGKLLSDHSNNPYSILAALNLARQDFKDGEINSAHARLQWVIDQDGDLAELTHIARLRKARLFLSEDKIAEAKNLIAGIDAGPFIGSYAELRGDIAFKEGHKEEASKAYTEAIIYLESGPHQQLLQMKVDDLGSKNQKVIETNPPTLKIAELPNSKKNGTVVTDEKQDETVITNKQPISEKSEAVITDKKQDETVVTDKQPISEKSEAVITDKKQVETVVTDEQPISEKGEVVTDEQPISNPN